MQGTNYAQTQWFALQEFWSLFHADVGKKFVRVAKSELSRAAGGRAGGRRRERVQEEIIHPPEPNFSFHRGEGHHHRLEEADR